MRLRLAKQTVDSLAAPKSGTLTVWDSTLAGFGVRISKSGRKTFFIHKRTKAGKQIQLTLGVHGEITAAEARTAAAETLNRLAGGADPAEEIRQRRRMLTVAELTEKYLAEHAEIHKRPRSAAGDHAMIERIINPHFGNMPVCDLTHAQIAKLHRDLKGTPYAANRVLALLSKMFALAVHVWRLRADNPVIGIQRYPERRRERFLSLSELARLAEALANHPYRVSANALRMLLLTGARRGEVLGMSWEQVEAETGKWVKPAALTKQDRLHRVPLSAGAQQLLSEMQRFRKPGEPYVFPGRGPGEHLGEIKKTWASVCKAAGLEGVRIHDLRHTYASLLVSGGYSLPTIGALLGHTQPSTTHRYAHLADDPLQEATGRVDALLRGLVEVRDAEVTPIKKRVK